MTSDTGFLELCELASRTAADVIEDMVGSSDAYGTVYMGADGTPTKKIDAAAEDAILSVLKDDGRSMRLLSEEAGDIFVGERGDEYGKEAEPEFSVILDPLDGTYNAAFGIPFYGVSIAIAKPDLSGTSFGYVKNLADGAVYHAESGMGAFLNNDPISPSGNSDIHDLCKVCMVTVLMLNEQLGYIKRPGVLEYLAVWPWNCAMSLPAGWMHLLMFEGLCDLQMLRQGTLSWKRQEGWLQMDLVPRLNCRMVL